jgi:hypothetical protein
MKMKTTQLSFEQFLPILGTAICLVITVLVWQWVSSLQAIWPLPGLYFVEIPAVCAVAAGLFLLGGATGRAAVWSSAGILIAFSLLGAFSVGLYFFPVAVIFIIAALIADVKAKRSLFVHLAVYLAAGLVQGALMLAVIPRLVQ